MRLIADPAKGVNGADLRASLGAMREQVALRSVARAKGAGGYATDTPTTVATVPAEVINDGGSERYEADTLRGQARYLIRIRYRADVRAGWQVSWDGQTLEVLEAPIVDAKRRFVWLRCGAIETVGA